MSKTSKTSSKPDSLNVEPHINSLYCFTRDQKKFKKRKVGGTVRKSNGSTSNYSREQTPPGVSTVNRYPETDPYYLEKIESRRQSSYREQTEGASSKTDTKKSKSKKSSKPK